MVETLRHECENAKARNRPLRWLHVAQIHWPHISETASYTVRNAIAESSRYVSLRLNDDWSGLGVARTSHTPLVTLAMLNYVSANDYDHEQ